MPKVLTVRRMACIALIGLAAHWSCKKPYTPPSITAPNNYLVVEGIIAAGADSTIITLSRSVNLSQQLTTNPERGASVLVQSDQNDTYLLTEVDTGKYGAPQLNLNPNHKYRLHIVTADGRVYQSNYEPVKITPPIDTLGYRITNDGLNLYVNTHDATNGVQYYRWDYTETYIYESEIDAEYITNPNGPPGEQIVPRTPQQDIHICYVTLNSSTILLNSTAALKQSVIQNNMITQIPQGSEKLEYRYSINVKEYALTDSAYQFWSILQRNTQNIGTIFDVQPSEVSTDLYCVTNPSEPVIGYMSVSSISQKRIFINRSQVPLWRFQGGTCSIVTTCWPQSLDGLPQELTSGDLIPTARIMIGGCSRFDPTYYVDSVATYGCSDCRYHLGGKTVKPSFWR